MLNKYHGLSKIYFIIILIYRHLLSYPAHHQLNIHLFNRKHHRHMHNSLVIFIIKILRFFRAPGILATSPTGGLPESKGDWMLKVLIGNFLIKVIKRGKCHT